MSPLSPLSTIQAIHIYTLYGTLYVTHNFTHRLEGLLWTCSAYGKNAANLKQVLPKEIFTNWFEGNIIPYSYSEEENLLILDTMTNFLRDYVSKKYTDILETVAQDAIGARRGSS